MSDDLKLGLVLVAIVLMKLLQKFARNSPNLHPRIRHALTYRDEDELRQNRRMSQVIFLFAYPFLLYVAVSLFAQLIQIKTQGRPLTGTVVGFRPASEFKTQKINRVGLCPQIEVPITPGGTQVFTDFWLCLENDYLRLGNTVTARLGKSGRFIIDRPWTSYWIDLAIFSIVLLIPLYWRTLMKRLGSRS